MQVLDQSVINEKIGNLKGWQFHDNRIWKEYQLKDFKEALEFVNKVGDRAEEMDHHPDIYLHDWNKVTISVSTHSAGGVTNNDFKLAEKIENI